MAVELRTRGRFKGTRKGATLSVVERLAEMGCDPIVEMIKIAMDKTAPLDLRARLYAELAEYVAPKRNAIDVAAELKWRARAGERDNQSSMAETRTGNGMVLVQSRNGRVVGREG